MTVDTRQMEAAQQAAARLLALEQQLGPNMRAALETTSGLSIVQGQAYQEVPMKDPMPWLPVGSDIAWGLNDRVITVSGTANTVDTQPLAFDLPCAVYALTAAVRSTAAAAVPATGYANALDMFKVQVKTSNGRLFQTNPVKGSAIFGTGSWPRWLGRSCWRFNPGAQIQVLTTPLANNLEIDLVFWCVEITVGTNVAMQAR